MLAATMLAGCSSSGGGSDAKGSATSSNAVSGAGEAGLDLDHLPKPIATQTFRGKGDVKSIKIELVQLRNRGKLTQVVFALTPDMSTSSAKSVYQAFGERGPDVAAYDLAGLKKYGTVQSDYGSLGTDPVYTKLTSGTTTYYWALIPTPPSEKVDVQFQESVPMFENVAVPK